MMEGTDRSIKFQNNTKYRIQIKKLWSYSEKIVKDQWWVGEKIYATRYTIVLNDKKEIDYHDKKKFEEDLIILDSLFKAERKKT